LEKELFAVILCEKSYPGKEFFCPGKPRFYVLDIFPFIGLGISEKVS